MIGTTVVRLKSKKKIKYTGKVYDLSFVNDPYFFVSTEAINSDYNSFILSHNSPPDLDNDFMSDTDHITDEFLFSKYGKNRVIAVGTHSTFNEKGCLKDVVRAHFGAEETGQDSIVNQVTREMPENFEKEEITLKDWFENYPHSPSCSPLVKQWLTDPNNFKILQHTLKLQGQIRGFGKHAAGIVITPRECWEDMPTSIIPKQQSVVSAFSEADGSSKDLSALGILKLDRLKLSTINIVMDAVALIKKNHGKDITDVMSFIDDHFDDKNLYAELRLGLNHGVFQFESPVMTSLIRGINVDSFDELVAANALVRPGPTGIGANIEYIHNKFNPTEMRFPHPALGPILSETNGVMIYQEQIQFIANKISGMSLGDGDMLRRYMDKADKLIKKKASGQDLDEKEEQDKDYQNFLKYWDKLLKGAAEQGHAEADVNKIRDYMAKYLGYSFNKCLSKNHTVITETRGEVELLDVKIGEKILGYNPDSKKDEFVAVKNRYNNGKKSVHRVNTKYGHVLECTMDHKIMTYKGMMPLSDVINFIGYGAVKVVYANQDPNVILPSIPEYTHFVQMEEIGEVETYDLEIDSPHHNYYANGICVSNSHSVSYGFVAMQTLYLKHYYPTEFYTALLNNAKTSGDKDKAKIWLENTIAAAFSKGITVLPPSRKSVWDCSITAPHEITLGFSMLNGFGEVAYHELMDLTNKKGKKFHELTMGAFFELPLSKFNKSVFEACTKAGIFDDWSSSREYLLFLKARKKKKIVDAAQKSLFDMDEISVGVRVDETKYPPTSEHDKLEQFIEVCGFDMTHIKRVASIKRSIEEKASKTSVSVAPITSFNEDGPHYFFLNDVRYLKTKTNKDYLELTVGDGISRTKLRVFEPMSVKISPELERGAVYITNITKNEKNFMNIKRGSSFKKIAHAHSDAVI